MKKWSLPEIVIFITAAALPAYLIRFHLGPLPMTALEVVLLGSIIALASQKTVIARSESERATRPVPRGVQSQGNITLVAKYTRLLRRLMPSRNDDLLLLVGSILILIATIIGIAVAPNKTAALGVAKAYFWEPMLWAWLLIATKPDREKAWRAGLGGLAVSAAMVIIYGLIQYVFPQLIPATWTAERRITSVFEYPNAAALFLAPIIALFLSSPAGLAVSALSLGVIAMAKSAGGLIAAAASLFFLGIMNKKTRLISIVFALAMTLIILVDPLAQGLRSQITMSDWSGRVHQIGWKESIAMLKDHPLFGAGLSGFPIVVKPYHHAQGVEIFQYPHNLFLAALSEIGLMGLIGLILVLIWFFKRAYTLHATRYTPYLTAAMVAMLVHGLVDVPYFKNDLSMLFWLLIVLVAL